MRINYAKELIKSGEYSITEIAIISGFCDVSYFSREFKKAIGVTPKDYLESIQ
jgi:AraC-like DNA-binding protein